MDAGLTHAELPDSVWEGREYTSIHAAIMFADLQNSVMISSTLPPAEYDQLVDDTQRAMLALVQELQANDFPVGEYRIAGDELAIFFYFPEEVAWNYLLDGPRPLAGDERERYVAECKQAKETLAYSAFKAAILLKNSWLVERFNTKRITDHQEPFELGMGVHLGRVFLRRRADGGKRIEGYAVNLAKRVEGACRQAKLSHIMFSQKARDVLCKTVVAHSQLRQRVFFSPHETELELLKGIAKTQKLYELKFYQRLGLRPGPEAMEQYEAIFALDSSNRWAYYQLVDHYLNRLKDYDQAYELASQALLVHPDDEKIMLDLAECHFHEQDYSQAKRYCENALALNESFDLAYERLNMIAEAQGDEEAQLEYAGEALRLSPGSPINHMNYALLVGKAGELAKAAKHASVAIAAYPEFRSNEDVDELLQLLDQHDALPDELREHS